MGRDAGYDELFRGAGAVAIRAKQLRAADPLPCIQTLRHWRGEYWEAMTLGPLAVPGNLTLTLLRERSWMVPMKGVHWADASYPSGHPPDEVCDPFAGGGSHGTWRRPEGGVEITAPLGATRLGCALPIKANSALCKFVINGSAKLANMLPVAQWGVDAGIWPASILAENGGAFEPDDRVMDTFGLYNFALSVNAATLYDHHVMGADELDPTVEYTFRTEPTRHQNAASKASAQYNIEQLTYGDPSLRLGDPGTEMRELIRFAGGNFISATEAAMNCKPHGASGPALVMASHGWEGDEGTLACHVDGRPLPAGALALDLAADPAGKCSPWTVGTEVVVERESVVRHPKLGGGRAGFATKRYQYRTTADGFVIYHSTRFDVATEAGNYYPVMCPVDGRWIDRGRQYGDRVTRELDRNDNSTTYRRANGVLFWQSDGRVAVNAEALDLSRTVDDFSHAVGEEAGLDDQARGTTSINTKTNKWYLSRSRTKGQVETHAAGTTIYAGVIHRSALLPRPELALAA